MQSSFYFKINTSIFLISPIIANKIQNHLEATKVSIIMSILYECSKYFERKTEVIFRKMSSAANLKKIYICRGIEVTNKWWCEIVSQTVSFVLISI